MNETEETKREIAFSLDLTDVLRQYKYDEEVNTVEAILLDMAAKQLLNRTLDNEAKHQLAVRVREIRDLNILEQIQPLVAEAIAQSVQRTDGYGKPVGEPVTIADEVVRVATEHLRSGGTPHSGRSKTVIQSLIESEVERVISREFKASLDAGKAELSAALKERGAQVLSETIVRMAGAQ